MDWDGGPLAIITFLRGRVGGLDRRRPPLQQSHLRFVVLDAGRFKALPAISEWSDFDDCHVKVFCVCS
jgi:hypothetical protein